MMNLGARILAGINRTVVEFQKAPFRFLYECDIQCELFSALRFNIPERVRVHARDKAFGSYEMALVYTEYKSKIDIVCLDQDALLTPDTFDYGEQSKFDVYIYALPILVGIELKYAVMGYQMGYQTLLADYQKLKSIAGVSNWLAIGFFQSDLQWVPFRDSAGYKVQEGPLDNIDCLRGIFAVEPRGVHRLETPPGA